MQTDTSPRRTPCIRIVGWFALVLAVIVAAALITFWLFLADYQSSLPQNLTEEIFAAYQANDARKIGRYSDNLPDAMKDPAVFSKYYKENASIESLYVYPGASADPEELCFEFAAENKLISTLTLRKTTEKSRFGFVQYEVKSLTGYPLTEYTITAPSDVLVFAGDRLIGERYCVEDQTTTEYVSVLNGTAYGTKTYQITDFTYLDTDALTAISKDDCAVTVTWDETRRNAVVEKQVTPAEQTQISEFAVQFSQVYSVFATRLNGARAPVVQMLYPDTPFHRALLLYNNDWGEGYSSDRFEKRVVDHFTRYSPTEFSCDIRFDYVIQFRDGFEKTYPYYMTYYLTSRNGKLLLLDMQPKTS